VAPQNTPACTLMLNDTKATWCSAGHAENGFRVHGRGYTFLGDAYFCGQDLVDAVCNHVWRARIESSARALKELIPTLNGCWALVAEWPDRHVLAATDRVRSIPLFYAKTPSGLMISSSIHPILDAIGSASIDEQAALEYLLAGYVTGAETLYEGVRQIQAAEILEYSGEREGDCLVTQRYYRFLPSGDSNDDEDELERQLEAVLNRVFSRYAGAIGGQQLVIPLSGGLDSRLIAAMLKRHGVKDVLCVSYGVPGNSESTSSRSVARVLGYEWHFAEYDGAKWVEWMFSPEMDAYWNYAMQGCSLPAFRDLPAVSALRRRRNLDSAIFLPGHMGDVVAGSHIPLELHDAPVPPLVSDVAAAVLRHHFVLWGLSEEARSSTDIRHILDRLQSQLHCEPTGHTCCNAAKYEMWDIENRQAKFIVNSVRVYESCDQRWALPLWDYELVEFFSHIPEGLRWKQRLYANTLANKVFVGHLQTLREIPLTTGLSPRQYALGEMPRQCAWRRAVVALLRRLGLEPCARQVRARFTTHAFCPLRMTTGLTRGRHPGRVTVSALMEANRVREALPPPLWDVILPSAPARVAQVYRNGLLSAITLARVCRETRSGSHGNASGHRKPG